MSMHVNPYLMFDGRCEEAFNFYAKVFGGKIVAMMPHKGSPAEGHVPPEWQAKILHARLAIGDDTIMGSDSPPDRYQPMQGFSVTMRIKEIADAERVFNALAEKATVTMPLGETFFAHRFGMLTDRYGTPWMIVCEKPMQS
jgi:PhnB protein